MAGGCTGVVMRGVSSFTASCVRHDVLTVVVTTLQKPTAFAAD